MDDLLNEFLTESAESLAVLDVELVKFEQNPQDTAGDAAPPSMAAPKAGPETPPAAAAPQKPSTAATEKSPPKESSVAAPSIRVDVEVLEDLMTLVNEMVLTRNQLMQMVRGKDDSEFTAPCAAFRAPPAVICAAGPSAGQDGVGCA